MNKKCIISFFLAIMLLFTTSSFTFADSSSNIPASESKLLEEGAIIDFGNGLLLTIDNVSTTQSVSNGRAAITYTSTASNTMFWWNGFTYVTAGTVTVQCTYDSTQVYSAQFYNFSPNSGFSFTKGPIDFGPSTQMDHHYAAFFSITVTKDSINRVGKMEAWSNSLPPRGTHLSLLHCNV